MVADITGTPVICPEITDTVALGAALQAAWCHQGAELASLCERLVHLDNSSRAVPDPRASTPIGRSMPAIAVAWPSVISLPDPIV
ncbi:hypothetical protein [Halomonas urmiana]|uniref:hypothetical protein n=1 Tax=Halomonas urmiana TaxID=490901 RepID=UPI0030840EAD